MLDDFIALSIAVPDLVSRLSAVSAVDGRYGKATSELRSFCSEAGLQHFRTIAEVQWLLFLHDQGLIKGDKLPDKLYKFIRNIGTTFNLSSATKVKDLEKALNHDVKAVEIYIANQLKEVDIGYLAPYVHILLTSEDVTNAAYAFQTLLVRDRICNHLNKVVHILEVRAESLDRVPMLAHTHGQAASPTTVGKELMLFAFRLRECRDKLMALPIKAKWNGASGNFNAHRVTYPGVDWPEMSKVFVNTYLKLDYLSYTTQTNNYAYLADILHQYKNICSILLDMSKDMWLYISYDYFGQKPKDGEVGSSTMPHKVNPIDFENAEGNLGLAELVLGYLASKLQQSRLQRDLSDSTTLRNMGTVYGWMVIGLKSIQRGLGKLVVNQQKLAQDLKENPAILAEAIQMILRKNGITDAYDQLKQLTRGKKVAFPELRDWIFSMKDKLAAEDFDRLVALTPENYTGFAADLVASYLKEA